MNLLKKHWKKITIIATLAAFIIIAALIVYFNEFTVDFRLKGKDIVLEYGEDYEVESPKAVLYGTVVLTKGMNVETTTEHNLNLTTIGTYEVTHYTKYLWFEFEEKQTITIRDTKKPVIELNYIEGQTTFPGTEYVEEGFVAKDNYDGDITDKVTKEVRDGVVYYTVEDSSGNKATAEREIIYYEDIAPVITLQGNTEVYIDAYEEYVEPGYSAVDNVDGDITDKVVVEGTIDTKKPGKYNLTYTVKDTYENTCQVTRTVIVKVKKQTISSSTTVKDKIVYLTFDDGPGRHTERLLEILAKYNVKATFFVVNHSEYNYLIKKEAQAGHTVAIHCNNHDYKTIYSSVEAYFEDLYKMFDIIYQQTGIMTNLIRFPGGGSNKISRSYCKGIMTELTKEIANRGFVYFDWNVDSNDAGGARDKETVVNNVINGIMKHNVSVVLQHDIKGFSVDAVEDIIVWGLANGYTFLPLTEKSPNVHHKVNN